MKFQQLMKTEMLEKRHFLLFKLSDVVFIMLINVKMPTKCCHFSIYENDKFYAQLSMKKALQPWSLEKVNPYPTTIFCPENVVCF